MAKRKLRLRGLVASLLLLLVSLLIIVGLALWFLPGLVLADQEVLLLIGADKRPDEQQSRADTIILAFCDWQGREVQLVSVPRDSYLPIAGREGKSKVNEAYFYGGAEMLQNTLEQQFQISIDHTFELDFQAFAEIIDALGGVEINVPYAMVKLSEGINLEPGEQRLNGEDALGFVRFRDLPMGDIDRIGNQQQFMRALSGQFQSPKTLLKAPQLLAITIRYCQTDCNPLQIAALGGGLLKTDLAQLQLHSLPGTPQTINRRSYWVLDEAKVQTLLAQLPGK